MNSKKKGNRNERKTAKLFETWTGYPFERVPSSGGLRWAKKSDTVGDIICTDEHHSRYFTFSIECKAHAEINFSELLLPNKGVKILEFWSQACEDATRANRIPILLMRFNGMPSDFYFVVLSSDYVDYLNYHDNDGTRFVISNVLEYLGDKMAIRIFPSTDLFKWPYGGNGGVHKLNKAYIKNGKT